MTRANVMAPAGTQPRFAPHVIMGAILLLLPVLSVQGPGHTTPMDAISVVFVGVYWTHLLLRHERMTFPLLIPFWLILLGSCCGFYVAHDRARAVLEVSKELYSYVWFISVAHFMSRRCDIARVAGMWVVVASVLALLMSADAQAGLLGGMFAARHRAAGTFLNPNMAGSYLVMAFFLAWALGAAGRRRFYLALPALVAGCIATASNGTAMSLAAGAMVAGVLMSGRRLNQLIGVGCIVGAVAVGGIGAGYERLLKSSMDQVSQGKRDAIGGTAMEGASERFPLWLDAADSLRRVPTGVGPGNFNRQGGSISGDFHGAHNTYVGMLVERGPLGLIGWLAILGSVAVLVSRMRAAVASGVRLLAVEPLFGALAALAVHSVVMEMFHFRHVWMLIAVMCAAGAQASAQASTLVSARRAAATEQPRPFRMAMVNA